MFYLLPTVLTQTEYAGSRIRYLFWLLLNFAESKDIQVPAFGVTGDVDLRLSAETASRILLFCIFYSWVGWIWLIFTALIHRDQVSIHKLFIIRRGPKTPNP
jgi:hypothetical protein